MFQENTKNGQFRSEGRDPLLTKEKSVLFNKKLQDQKKRTKETNHMKKMSEGTKTYVFFSNNISTDYNVIHLFGVK